MPTARKIAQILLSFDGEVHFAMMMPIGILILEKRLLTSSFCWVLVIPDAVASRAVLQRKMTNTRSTCRQAVTPVRSALLRKNSQAIMEFAGTNFTKMPTIIMTTSPRKQMNGVHKSAKQRQDDAVRMTQHSTLIYHDAYSDLFIVVI